MDKRICWAVKIANSLSINEKLGLTNEALSYYENRMLGFAISEGVPEPDTLFCAAAAAKISELFYNMLNDKEKEACNALVNATQIETGRTFRKAKTNRNGEFDDEN